MPRGFYYLSYKLTWECYKVRKKKKEQIPQLAFRANGQGEARRF